MTKAETVRLFALISASYPRDKSFADADAQMVGVWARMLADVPYKMAEKAAVLHAASSVYPPSIAEIMQFCAKNTQELPDADQAWGIVMDTVRKHGYYEPAEAKESMPEIVWEAVMRVWPSWQHFCTSENMMAERAHFMRVWEMYRKRSIESALIPENMRLAANDVKQLKGGA